MNSIKIYLAGLAICLSLFFMSRPAAAQNSLSAYTGKYTRNFNGFDADLNIYIKNNKLMVRQWWDGKTRTLELVADNKFIISMDGWAIQFIRNRANKVIQMQVLANEIWIKV
jgi:hypothetical protein